MKLVHPEIQTIFQFSNGSFPAVVIENPSFFYRFTDDLCRQCNGESGETVLSSEDIPISISGNLDLHTNFLPFEINRKNLVTKITSRLEKQALAPEFYERNQRLLGEVEKFLLDLAFQNDIDLEFPKLSISGLLKSAGLCLKEDDLPLPEKILTYMELMRANALASVFVFVNLRSFLNDDTMEKFTMTCCSHEYNIMLIDNREYNRLTLEKRTVIDADLCEF
jgi:CRISPR type II-A-associated protein Csn2